MRNISTKLLISIGMATIFFAIFCLYQTYSLTNKRVREVVEQQASMALKFDLAIRKYIAENVRPVMSELLGPDEFMPETMSTSYVARTIFEDVRQEFPNYIIKFASDNPRNPVNQAGPEELKIIEYFNNNPHVKRWEGEISIDGEQYVAKFSPMRMEESCLRCHSDPKYAPASLLKRYGSTAGFHRPLGQVIGMDTIAIPMAKIAEQLWSKSMQTILVGGLGLFLFFLTIIFTTKFIITNRLTIISSHFANAARQEDYSKINHLEVKGKDEIFDLAFSFNTLSDRLKGFYSSLDRQVKERTRELENTNEQLKQEIGEREQAEEALRERTHELGERVKDLNCLYGISNLVEKPHISLDEIFQGVADIIPPSWQYPETTCARIILESQEYRTQNFRETDWKQASDIVVNGERTGTVEVCSLREKPEIDEDPSLKEERYLIKAIAGRLGYICERYKDKEKKKNIETQLLQSEKMASIGQLAAGVAHEINNPTGFVSSNLKTLSDYIKDISGLTEAYRSLIADLQESSAGGGPPDVSEQIKRILALEEEVDIEFILNDISELIEESREGSERIRAIVQDLKDFAHPGEDKLKFADINKNLDSTVNVVGNELKYKAEVTKDYGDLPEVQCYPQLLNQVFVNILVNAAQAIEERGEIRIQTRADNGHVEIKISDTGSGIPEENLAKIFDPFFTTKDVGKGTGLGLNVVYNIIQKHHGKIDVESDVGKGTTFTIRIPVE